MIRLSISCLFLMSCLLSTIGACAQTAESSAGRAYCYKPGFYCVNIKSGQTWARLYPDQQQRAMVMALNRTNVALKYRHWIIVPRQLKSLSYLDLAPFPLYYQTNGHKLLLISLPKYAFAAYDAKGDLIYWGPATGGRAECDNSGQSCLTKAGDFKVYRIQDGSCISNKYPLDTNGGAEMPWCMHYFGAYAIHGSNLAGFEHHSHGCVRLFYKDARWLNLYFVHYGTRVVVIR